MNKIKSDVKLLSMTTPCNANVRYSAVQSIAVQDDRVSNQVLKANHKFNKLSRLAVKYKERGEGK